MRIESSMAQSGHRSAKVERRNKIVHRCAKIEWSNGENAYPQQNINRILGRLKGNKYLTALDMNDALYQIELDEDSRPKTAFSVPSLGTFMYRRMPMGLCNSGATLCELIDSLFGSAFEPETFP